MSDHSDEGHHVPLKLVLERLGISELDLHKGRVEVNADGLRLLLSEFARRERFDEAYYIDKYNDVKAANLSGDVTSLSDHYAIAGYFEGRLPRDLPFDAAWYWKHYSDLSATFAFTDKERLKQHFFETGLKEGRSGLEENLSDAERWR